MEQEVLDTQEVASAKELTSDLNAMTILSMIGSGLYMLLGVIALVAAGYVATLFGAAEDAAVAQGASSAQAADAADAAGGMITTIIVIAGLIIIGLSLLTLLGAMKMRQFKKNGFVMYMIGNGIMILLMLISVIQGGTDFMNILFFIATLGFTGFFFSKRALFSE